LQKTVGTLKAENEFNLSPWDSEPFRKVCCVRWQCREVCSKRMVAWRLVRTKQPSHLRADGVPAFLVGKVQHLILFVGSREDTAVLRCAHPVVSYSLFPRIWPFFSSANRDRSRIVRRNFTNQHEIARRTKVFLPAQICCEGRALSLAHDEDFMQSGLLKLLSGLFLAVTFGCGQTIPDAPPLDPDATIEDTAPLDPNATKIDS